MLNIIEVDEKWRLFELIELIRGVILSEYNDCNVYNLLLMSDKKKICWHGLVPKEEDAQLFLLFLAILRY